MHIFFVDNNVASAGLLPGPHFAVLETINRDTT